MAQQMIALGNSPDGADGDDARTAFTKTNGNFTELYQGLGNAQPSNAKLTAIAGSVWAANQLLVTTGADTLAMLATGTTGRALIAAADAAAGRTALSLGNVATDNIVPVGRGGTGGANAADARAGLGLGTAATQNVGTSGTSIPLLSNENTFDAKQVFKGVSAASVTTYCAEFQGSPGVTNGNRMIFSQNALYAAAMAANGTGSTAARMTFQWIERSTGALQSTPMELMYDGSLVMGGIVRPSSDNSRTLGTAAQRWSTVYAGTGAINTSDAREKTQVRPLTGAELAAARDLSKEIGAFRFLSAVAEKGSDQAREHIGMTVQRAIDVMQRHGLDPYGYSFICYDSWEDVTVDHPAVYEVIEVPAVFGENGEEITPATTANGAMIEDGYTEVIVPAGDRYSFRMDGLLAFIAAGLEARLSALESA